MATAIGKSVVLKRQGAEIPNMISVQWAGINWNTQDVTPHDSNNYTVTAPTLKTHGAITFTIVVDSAESTHSALQSDAITGSAASYALQGGPFGNWTFPSAYVTGYQPVTNKNEHIAIQVTLTPAGAATVS